MQILENTNAAHSSASTWIDYIW